MPLWHNKEATFLLASTAHQDRMIYCEIMMACDEHVKMIPDTRTLGTSEIQRSSPCTFREPSQCRNCHGWLLDFTPLPVRSLLASYI
jgi:hypothetical protein